MLRILMGIFAMSLGSLSAASWVERSDAVAKEFALSAQSFDPEFPSSLGFDALDERPSLPSESADQAQRTWYEGWIKRLADLKKQHKDDPELQLDLELLEEYATLGLEDMNIQESERMVAFINVPQRVMNALAALTDEQMPPKRRQAAQQRFHHYVQGFQGQPSLCESARRYTQAQVARWKDRSFFPLKAELEDALSKWPSMMNAIEASLKSVAGADAWRNDWPIFQQQLENYRAFVEKDLLPQARTTPPLPRAYYQLRLKRMGVHATPEELITKAKQDFDSLQAELQTLAQKIAADHRLGASDSATVAKYLRAHEAKTPQQALATFQGAEKTIATLIRAHDLFTLPATPLRMRVGTADESRAMPIPHVRIPSFINNTGQRPEFLIPDPSLPEVNGGNTSPAESMTLMAHEGRPGHDLQFSRIFESRPSIVRAVLAETSTNAEGWALYAEFMMQPYFDTEAQFMSVYWRLARCARMMLDPQVQTGQVSEKDVKSTLTRIGMTPEFAAIEYKRYSFLYPGQATSYYYGLLQILDVRERAKRALGDAFRERAFHDAILSYGTVPVARVGESIVAGLKKSAALTPLSVPVGTP